jgi:hypothetical protein
MFMYTHTLRWEEASFNRYGDKEPSVIFRSILEATDYEIYKFQNVSITSPLFNCLENRKTTDKSAGLLGIKWVFHFSSMPFRTFFARINIWQVTLEICAETQVHRSSY